MFAFVLATLVAAAGDAPAYLASCPNTPTRVLATSTVSAPDNIHPTNRRARVVIDLGSDGRIRNVTITESSGDAVFDTAATDAARRFRFAPQTQGCISTSSVVPEEFNVPLIALARPVPGASGGVSIAVPPEGAATVCGTPAVQLTGLDVPDTRQAPGTAALDVALDSAAHVTSVKLATSSGNPKTDAAATAEARSAQYAYALPPGCRSKATTYRLELTFK